ncbi:efflux RND transporter periplasmic adaptor subunit [Crateriforma conspicua]|uniref:Cobalt-zinc-cadmium resistance protein CzcB n=1 Tax=Crateriforma conspicua TaxID=2527996 RepID=A0A5C6FNT5_9PLAN|nr:efflux RND transporter periplasmic adaptor subunit [Crateriforma conspicua]TWU63059.1 Cobalt-zinc-cadmium resistance protein CzcB [Crateriforma conspicua]
MPPTVSVSNPKPSDSLERPATSILTIVWKATSWIPTACVFAVLGVLAWYGHATGWTLPSFSTLTANQTPDAKANWCPSHGVPEEICIVCRPNLLDDAPSLTYCNTHGVHGCVLENPTLAETSQPAEVTDQDLRRADHALQSMPRPTNLPISSTAGVRIQFASMQAMEKAGVDVEPVTRRTVIESIDAAGIVRYDATKLAQVSPPADGTVKRILVQIGQWVDQGQTLGIVDCAEAGRIKAELQAALSHEHFCRDNLRRLRPLAGSAVSGKRILDAENQLQQARADVDDAAGRLANLGLPIDIDHLRTLELEAAKMTVRRLGRPESNEAWPQDLSGSNLIVVTAPLQGVVTQLRTNVGEVVNRGNELFRVVDTRQVWLDLRVPAEQAEWVHLGQTVRYRPDGQDKTHEGQLTWISTDVDPTTRTVAVRAVLKNPDQSLRNESFGLGQVILRQEPDSIVVPETALQWDGDGHVVFVRDSRFFEKDRPKFFVTRSVRPGARQAGFVEIIAGVLPGEVVATKGSDVLRAQLLRGNLGAGCTCGR